MFDKPEPTPIIPLDLPQILGKKLKIYLKRDDLIDNEISGNKWRKLKYNLLQAKSLGYKQILTFGGAYSNHISATAAACQRFGFESIGIIRGDELDENANHTLRFASSRGMKLHFVDRSSYRKKSDADWLKRLSQENNAFIVPEGGTNDLALKGVAEMVDEIDMDFDYLICPVGTGGTLAGIASALTSNQTALGISSLKGADYLYDEIHNMLGFDHNWQINHDYHFGGYAKSDSHLIDFINDFKDITAIPLDPVYTGKMMFAVMDLIKKDKFESGMRLICIHTGGLQGIDGFNEKNENRLKK